MAKSTRSGVNAGSAASPARASPAPAGPGSPNKDVRLALLDKAIAAAQAAADTASAGMGSGNPDEEADAAELVIDAKNRRDDLLALRALLANQTNFRPVSTQDVENLDDLAQVIDARIQAGVIVNGTVAIATEVLSDATAIGQILQRA